MPGPEYKEVQQVAWKGIGNPQPGYIHDPNGIAVAIIKAVFGRKKNTQGKAVKGAPNGK